MTLAHEIVGNDLVVYKWISRVMKLVEVVSYDIGYRTMWCNDVSLHSSNNLISVSHHDTLSLMYHFDNKPALAFEQVVRVVVFHCDDGDDECEGVDDGLSGERCDE